MEGGLPDPSTLDVEGDDDVVSRRASPIIALLIVL